MLAPLTPSPVQPLCDSLRRMDLREPGQCEGLSLAASATHPPTHAPSREPWVPSKAVGAEADWLRLEGCWAGVCSQQRGGSAGHQRHGRV